MARTSAPRDAPSLATLAGPVKKDDIAAAGPSATASVRATYERHRERRAREVASFDARSRRIATVRLSLAVTVLALVGGIAWARLGAWAWAALGATLAAFVVLVVLHARVHDARERAAAGLRFHERGLARLAHAWDQLPVTSVRFQSRDHPFSGDLDVFGRASLMQLVDVTETRFGEEHLARLLSLESPGEWPDDVVARQQAVRDLAGRSAFREALAMAGGVLAEEKPDPSPMLVWAESKDAMRPSPLTAWVLSAIAVAAPVFGIVLHAPAGTLVASVLVVLVVGIGLGVRLTPVLEAVSARESAVTRWRAMIAVVERERFEAPLLLGLQDRLARGPRRASEELGALERIVGFVDARRNEVFRFFIGPLLMWDVHCTAALLRWRARAGGRVRGWLDALGELEALSGLAAFAFEHPEFAWPEPASEPMLDARGLGHPLIADNQRVGNDVRLPSAGRALIVTGSNMSGKSTLLRALGVNAVLAFAGAPACARALTIGPARVATSMRIEDSLDQGVSHFYAELQRLKRVLDRAVAASKRRNKNAASERRNENAASERRNENAASKRRRNEDRERIENGEPVLFLLDEILHGTNSRERVLGARAIVEQLVEHGALGAVSTHDLGIAALERELSGRVHNVHFEEQVEGEKMTFDYVLRPGVVQSSNALRLMRALGIIASEI
jgi:predicted ATPase